MSIFVGDKHALHPWFSAHNDELIVAGRPLTEIAAQVGTTPFYAYDRSVMTRKVDLLRQTFPKGVHLHYAVKANPMPAVVRHMLALTDGLDLASAGEMQVALDAGADAKLISMAGPGKTDNELARAAAADITINIESERELRVLAQIGAQTKRKPRVAIRVNPDFELKSSGMKMSGGPKQFGIDSERVPEVLRSMTGLPVEFHGFHIFSGSQNLRPDAIVEAQTKSVALAIELAKHAPAPVRSLNIGGGLGIPLFPGEQMLDLAPIAANLLQLVPQVKQHLPHTELVLELGRYLVGESGIYVCKIIDRKISRGQVFLVSDGGLHHHLSASGNFGQVVRKNHPVAIGNRLRGSEREIASVVGPLCTPLDLLADRMDLARAEPGDLVVVFQSGAYGFTASPLAFLSHPPPKEILL
jgi:diaminopimelate decarboxylase